MLRLTYAKMAEHYGKHISIILIYYSYIIGKCAVTEKNNETSGEYHYHHIVNIEYSSTDKI